MEWEKINKKMAEAYYDAGIEENQSSIEPDYRPEYQDLRISIMKAYKETLEELNINEENLRNYTNIYKFDCIFGIKIYKIFTDGKYKIKEKIASNDNVWRYIQLCVVPDVIEARWGIENRDRFYKTPRRLYLKILWWYVYLSWNNNIEETKRLIIDEINTSDTLAQLVERSGKNGYPIELFRAIMKKKTEKRINTLEFRKLMVLNSARIKVINPYLVKGGVNRYVDDLIKDARGF